MGQGFFFPCTLHDLLLLFCGLIAEAEANLLLELKQFHFLFSVGLHMHLLNDVFVPLSYPHIAPFQVLGQKAEVMWVGGASSERNHCISSGGIAIEMITLITLITLITCWHYK